MSDESAKSREADFVGSIQRLCENDRGARARLRASLRRAPGRDPGAYTRVYPLLGGILERDEWRWFLVAGLVAKHGSGTETVGHATRRLVDTGHSKQALTSRFERLLSSTTEELPERLTHHLALLGSAGVVIDGVEVLRQLRSWDHPDRYVQRRWARDFYLGPDDTRESEGEEQ